MCKKCVEEIECQKIVVWVCEHLKEGEREREKMCVCMCVCEWVYWPREWEKERERGKDDQLFLFTEKCNEKKAVKK